MSSDLKSARPERQNKVAKPEHPNIFSQYGICQTDLKDISADIIKLAKIKLVEVKLVEIELIEINITY
jgi:hypothetical protein